MNISKNLLTLGVGVTMVVGLFSCDTGELRRTPGHIYAPDMTYSRAYDAYTSNPNFADSQTSRLPVEGTVARGHQLPDHMVEGDTNAYKAFTTNMRFGEDEIKEGGRLFNIYCAICHGPNMDGNGPLYSSGKFAAMPANFKLEKYLHMKPGEMYAAIKFGKNMMGSYTGQLDIKQRWMVIAYLKDWQSKNGGEPFAFAAGNVKADSSVSNAPVLAKNTSMAAAGDEKVKKGKHSAKENQEY